MSQYLLFGREIAIVPDKHLETILEMLFCHQLLFSFPIDVPSWYLSFLSVDADCYGPIQHLDFFQH